MNNGVAIITGGGSGLGEATARHLAARGLHPASIALPSSGGEEVAADLSGSFHPADVRSEELAAAVTEAAANGPVRALVTCAGIATPGRLFPREGVAELEHFARVIEVNLLGTINAVRLVAPLMGSNDLEDGDRGRSEEHTSELQSRGHLVCRLLLEKKNISTQKSQRT